jgi:hypothetical protein
MLSVGGKWIMEIPVDRIATQHGAFFPDECDAKERSREGPGTNLPTNNNRDDVRRVSQNIIIIAGDMGREWLDR